jgi:hypothetical protein
VSVSCREVSPSFKYWDNWFLFVILFAFAACKSESRGDSGGRMESEGEFMEAAFMVGMGVESGSVILEFDDTTSSCKKERRVCSFRSWPRRISSEGNCKIQYIVKRS